MYSNFKYNEKSFSLSFYICMLNVYIYATKDKNVVIINTGVKCCNYEIHILNVVII